MSRFVTERYANRIVDVLSCSDRIVITGRVPVICCAWEIGSQFSTRIAGTCGQHRVGKSSIKT